MNWLSIQDEHQARVVVGHHQTADLVCSCGATLTSVLLEGSLRRLVALEKEHRQAVARAYAAASP